MLIKKIKFLILFSIVAFIAIAQDGTFRVSGTVTDEDSRPLVNASVKAGNRGVVTDEEGKFTITVNSRNAILEISSVGYEMQRIKSNTDNPMLIKLAQSQSANLGDVVVVGVQRQNKRTSIASLGGITSEDIENRPVASVDALLQGRVAGLNVQINSGEPGIAPTVVVRGNSRLSQNIGNIEEAQSRALSGPLYVIDGVPVDPAEVESSGLGNTGTNYLAGINVNDIENVIVQKDAVATAAWGSRGANGVIYITTRKGVSKKPIFTFNIYGGLTQKPKLLKTYTGAEERRLKMQILRDYATSADQLANLPQILTDSLNPYFNNATDWQGPFYRNGMIRNVDINMAAASEYVNYRISAGYYNEDGIIKSTGFQRYSFRGNFGFTISPKLNSDLVIGLTKSDRQRGAKSGNSDSNTPFDGGANSIGSQPSSFYLLNQFDLNNYLGLASNLRNENNDNLYNASLTIRYKIIPTLTYTMQGAANITNNVRDYFKPSNIDAVEALSGTVQPSQAQATDRKYNNYMWMNRLDWSKALETKGGTAHNINATLSHEYNTVVNKGIYLNGYNTPSNNIQVVSGIPQQDLSGYSFYSHDALLGFMGQLSYDFNRKYLFYASYRADASSRFGANNKWGYFPAIGAGWVVSDEKFFSGLKDFVDLFKIRGSYGVSGRRSQEFYAPYNTYNVSGTYGGEVAVQPSFTNGLTKNDLTWARSIQKNIGFDLEMFNHRINITADIYDRLMKDDFYQFVLPDFTGYSEINFNAKDLWVSNRGLDLNINTRNMARGKPFQW
ncbi:MAG: SusC/RagA family TonB-linked outer membrane protein, partial [Niabella sp.]